MALHKICGVIVKALILLHSITVCAGAYTIYIPYGGPTATASGFVKVLMTIRGVPGLADAFQSSNDFRREINYEILAQIIVGSLAFPATDRFDVNAISHPIIPGALIEFLAQYTFNANAYNANAIRGIAVNLQNWINAGAPAGVRALAYEVINNPLNGGPFQRMEKRANFVPASSGDNGFSICDGCWNYNDLYLTVGAAECPSATGNPSDYRSYFNSTGYPEPLASFEYCYNTTQASSVHSYSNQVFLYSNVTPPYGKYTSPQYVDQGGSTLFATPCLQQSNTCALNQDEAQPGSTKRDLGLPSYKLSELEKFRDVIPKEVFQLVLGGNLVV